jgi:hypothetical protein
MAARGIRDKNLRVSMPFEKAVNSRETDGFSPAEVPVSWEHFGALIDGSQGLLASRRAERGEGAFMCGGSYREGITLARVSQLWPLWP